MKLLRSPAILIRSHRFGEADKIVVMLGEKFGKRRAVARGARRIRNRFGSALEPLSISHVTLVQKETTDLAILDQAELKEHFPHLRQSYEHIMDAFHMVKLAEHTVMDGQQAPEIYRLISEFLHLYDQTPTLHPLYRHAFDWRLLGLSGVKPDLLNCVRCRSQLSRNEFRFHFRSGGFLCSRCCNEPDDTMRVSPVTVSVLRTLDQTQTDYLQRIRLNTNQNTGLTNFLRRLLAYLLEQDISPADPHDQGPAQKLSSS